MSGALSSNRTRILLASCLATAAVVAYALVWGPGTPLRALTGKPLGSLVEEAETLGRCLECHEGADMHTCSTCHEGHGEVTLAGVAFDGVLELVGDVPQPGVVAFTEIIPHGGRPHGGLELTDVLAARGVEAFESVALFSGDGSQATIASTDLGDEALLLPHVDGIRFADEQQHYSTWLKGLTRIVVVGPERPLIIDGQSTSIGRLLLGTTVCHTVEETGVMLADPDDGTLRKGRAGLRLQGVALAPLLHVGGCELTRADGSTHELTAAETATAMLTQQPGGLTVVLPARGRAAWPAGVVAVASKEEDEP